MVLPVSDDKHVGSFLFGYLEFIKAVDKRFSPVCNGKPAPVIHIDIIVNDKVWGFGEYPAQGCLFGKMYV